MLKAVSLGQINSPLGASELREKEGQGPASETWCYLSRVESCWGNRHFQPEAQGITPHSCLNLTLGQPPGPF